MPTFKERTPLQTVYNIETGNYQMFKLMEARLLFQDDPNNLIDIPTHENIEELPLFQKMSQQNLGNIYAAFTEEDSNTYFPTLFGKKAKQRTLAFSHQTKHSIARIVITSITTIALGSFLYLKTIAKPDDKSSSTVNVNASLAFSILGGLGTITNELLNLYKNEKVTGELEDYKNLLAIKARLDKVTREIELKDRVIEQIFSLLHIKKTDNSLLIPPPRKTKPKQDEDVEPIAEINTIDIKTTFLSDQKYITIKEALLEVLDQADDLNIYEQLKEDLKYFISNKQSASILIHLLINQFDTNDPSQIRTTAYELADLFQENYLLKIDLFFFEYFKPTDARYPAKEIHQKIKEYCNSLDPQTDTTILLEKLKEVIPSDLKEVNDYLTKADDLLKQCNSDTSTFKFRS